MDNSGQSNDGQHPNDNQEKLKLAVDELNRGMDDLIADVEKKFGIKIPVSVRKPFGISETIEIEVRDKTTGELKEHRLIEKWK